MPEERGPAISDQIASNRRRSLLLLVGFVALVAIAGLIVDGLVGGRLIGVGVAVVLGVLLAAASYLYSDRLALSLSRAVPADPDEYARYHNLVEGLCVAAGLPKPELFVVDDDAPNAFATGRNPDHAAVVVTTGLLDKLSRVELEGVLAHELSHIRNYDILVTTIAVTLIGPLVVLAPFAGKVMQLAVSRRRESVADVTGVRLTRYPPGLISALEKMRSDGTVVRSRSRATAHLWIESPAGADGGSGLATTHPPLEERIAALKEL